MLRGTLSEDIDLEVNLVHLLVIIGGILVFNCLTLSLQLSKCTFKVLLLFLESSLDDLSSDQESLLQVLEGLVLDMDSRFLIKILVLKLQLLQDWEQVVLGCFILNLIGNLLLVLLHLVSGLLVDTLFEDLAEDLVRLTLRPLLLNNFLLVTSQVSLA